MSKTCIECNVNLLLEKFYKGRNKCKKCVKQLSLCPHNTQKNLCKKCGGKTLCPHGKTKSRCLECGGASLCIHDPERKKRKDHCIICCPLRFCIHEKQKNQCKECNGSSFCEHKKSKSTCKLCNGSSICCHLKRRYDCKLCNGKGICSHNKIKHNCIICTPSSACTECKMIYVNKKSLYKPLCQGCFCNKYPDHEKSTLYKIKERYLQDELRLRFPNIDINMVFDKEIEGGCSKKRPDVLIDLLLYSIIIECDEGQHKNYECENKRTMQLFEDLGNRPLILIRFNPDSYIENNKKIEGCFVPLITIEDIHKKKFYELNEKEWKRRVDILEEVIRGKMSDDDIPEKEVEEIKLFYDV
jgi:hypothetical protein